MTSSECGNSLDVLHLAVDLHADRPLDQLVDAALRRDLDHVAEEIRALRRITRRVLRAGGKVDMELTPRAERARGLALVLPGVARDLVAGQRERALVGQAGELLFRVRRQGRGVDDRRLAARAGEILDAEDLDEIRRRA